MEVPGSAKLFIMYYKKGKVLPLGEFYAPLFCGKFPGKKELPYLKDDVGENISLKNEFYSELTGIYWVWKNTKFDLVGICHYRRYFTMYPEPWYFRLKYFLTHPFKVQKGPNPLIYTNNVKKYTSWILTESQARQVLEDYDIILPRARVFRYSLQEHYKKYHSENDLLIVEEILKEKYPEMLRSWEQVLNGKILYANNMFMAKKHVFQEFMDWWFDMLFDFERKCRPEEYGGYQRRILGFIAERLLTLYVIDKGFKIKEMQLLYFKGMKNE
jgi:hypothetical protein